MVLKRKRSESELSFNSAFSSPQRPDTVGFDFSVSCAVVSPTSRGMFSTSSRSITPSHLPSRTMKRFRDNRPSETEVHQRTLNLLYSAQQHQQHPQDQNQAQPPQPGASVPVSFDVHNQNHRGGNQRSLHSFWNLPSPVPPPAPATSDSALTPPLTRPNLLTANACDDCGTALGDGGDVIMDVDNYGLAPEDHSCGACGKTVCFSCSVSNLGEHRRCLVCAGRAPPAGNIGWTTAGLGVC